MKIGIFTDTYKPEINGVVSSIDSYRRQFEAKGHEVFIFAPSQNRIFFRQSDGKLWRFPSVGFYGDKQIRIVLPIARSIKKELLQIPLDVIHTQTPALTGRLGVWLGEHKKITLAHTYHTFYEQYLHYAHLPAFALRKLVIRITKKFSERHDFIICPSSGMKKVLEGYGIKRPLEVLPTGADIEHISKILKDGYEIPKKYQINPKIPYLVTASRLGKEKNVEFLLLAMRRLCGSFPHLRLIITGDGPLRKSLEAETKKLGIETNIIFTGFITQAQLFSIYRSARAFIFSSLTETQGLVLLEALACGTPAVAVRAMGIEDMLKGDRGGFLTPLDLKLFCQKIEILLRDNQLLDLKKKEALARANELSISNAAERLLSLYEKTIESRKSHL